MGKGGSGSYLLLALRFGNRLVARMYLMRGLLAEGSDSRNDKELADLFSLRLNICLSCWYFGH
jgi:hypothetical protein